MLIKQYKMNDYLKVIRLLRKRENQAVISIVEKVFGELCRTVAVKGN